jgi:hypothetical protein
MVSARMGGLELSVRAPPVPVLAGPRGIASALPVLVLGPAAAAVPAHRTRASSIATFIIIIIFIVVDNHSLQLGGHGVELCTQGPLGVLRVATSTRQGGLEHSHAPL